MKKIAFLVWAILTLQPAWSQPIMQNRIEHIDFDGDSVNELIFSIQALQFSEPIPQRWDVGAGLMAQNLATFVVPSNDRTGFAYAEPIGAAGAIILPVDKVIGILRYLAESFAPTIPSFWTYETLGEPPFLNHAEFYLGLRLQVEGANHYAWVHFSRPVVDNHTMFEIVGHDWNPIPDAPIPAGEPPPPPPVQATTDAEGQLTFTWDNRIGEMVLEWSDRLDATAVWQPVPDSATSPVILPPGEGHRFFRLRRP